MAASLWPIHTLVFDLDDTLFTESDYVRSGFEAAGAWFERTFGVAGFSERAWELFAAGRRGRIFDEACAALGVKPEPAQISAMIGVYREHRPSLGFLPDAREALQWATHARFGLALVTDGYLGVQQRKAEALELNKVIPVQVFTDVWGREGWKPSPRGFQEIMCRCPGAASGFAYVADNPHKDFIAPKALGWRTVRIRRTAGEHGSYEATRREAAEREIASLTELSHMVQRE